MGASTCRFCEGMGKLSPTLTIGKLNNRLKQLNLFFIHPSSAE
jgi:hypothetical protein